MVMLRLNSTLQKVEEQLAEVERKYEDVHVDDNWRQNGRLTIGQKIREDQ